MTKPELADDTGSEGRTYGDTLPDCPLLEAHGWSGPFTGAPSVTKINKIIDRSGGLPLWMRRQAAEWMMDNTDLWPTIEGHKTDPAWWERMVHKYADMAGWDGTGPGSLFQRALKHYTSDPKLPDIDPDELAYAWHRKLAIDLGANASERHSAIKSKEGSYLHDVMEEMAAGRTPVALLPHEKVAVKQAGDWFDKWQPEFLYCETSVFSRTHGYAGTPDAFVKLPGYGVVLLDYKRKGQDAEDVAYQLVAYERADYLITKGLVKQRRPIPKVDGCMVVRFPPGDEPEPAITRPVTTNDETFETFLDYLKAYNRRNAKWLGKPIEPPAVAPGDPAKRAAIAGCIEVLRGFYPQALATLAANWPEGVPTLKQADNHTAPQLAAIQKALDAAEAAHQIPFGYADGSTSNPSMSNQETAAA